MSVQPRPIDTTTVDFLQLGMPFVEFAPLLSGGTFGPFRSLGCIDSAEVAKAVELVALRCAQSGVSILVRELVRQFDATLTVGLFQHSPENMQLLFASATNVPISGGITSKVDDPFNLTDVNLDFLDLSEGNIVEPLTAVTAAEQILEQVGTGQGGSFGETTGDFALDFKPSVIGDVTVYTETLLGVPTDRTGDLVAGAAPAGGQIGIEVGATAVSGEITYPGGEAPADGTLIEVTYEPSFAFVENTDFVVDFQQGRIRFFDFELLTPNTEPLRQFQPMEASYDFDEIDHNNLTPYTQFVFQGKTRVRLLTDVGINIIWEIPNTSVRITDDAFVFNRDEFQVSTLAITLLDNGGQQPFGIMEVYEETP